MDIVDFHSHILPKADHGSDSSAMSFSQIELIVYGGTGKVVATPHFYPNRHTLEHFLVRRNACAQRLASKLPAFAPTIYVGAEVLVCEGLDKMEGVEKLCIEGTKTILLEMPMTAWNVRLYDTVEAIKNLGLSPVMAHIDRYSKRAVSGLLELGVKAQVNAPAFCSLFSREHYLRLIDDDTVVAMGSDLHEAPDNGYYHFVKAQKIMGEERLEHLMKNSLACLEGAIPLRELFASNK